MKRQGVHMDGRIVDTQELAVAGIALGGLAARQDEVGRGEVRPDVTASATPLVL